MTITMTTVPDGSAKPTRLPAPAGHAVVKEVHVDTEEVREPAA